MTREQWKAVERLYHESLRRLPEARASFLAEACRGDDSLRAEVESLLSVQPAAAEFLEGPTGSEPAVAAVAGLLRELHEPRLPGRLAGQQVGAYRLQALIAAGGMGEVYRARDIRLDRTVAVKILPPHLTDNAERRQRFDREARIVSSLDHPHICALYDVGVHAGLPYLVMEYLEGETLEARLARGAVPWPQALEYLVQIADALEKASRRGVVHRDLKPANVMLTRSGVKLLDFGIAMRSTPEGRKPGWETVPADNNPLTQAGGLVGTVRYLSPEQLQGRRPDARSDIFAFGLLAYEMLAGHSPFPGTTDAEVAGAILRDEPAPCSEAAPLPDSLPATVLRCLARDPDERWQTASDLLFQLRSIAARRAIVEPRRTVTRLPRSRGRGLWAVAVVAVTALAWSSLRRQVEPAPGANSVTPAVRFSVDPAAGEWFAPGFDIPFALSPDGRYLAYVSAGPGTPRRLWLYSLGDESRRLLAGTEHAASPFWSPDGAWIGFFAAGTMKKIRVSTGVTQIVASGVTSFAGASWGREDVILFAGGTGGLSRVSADGGPVTRSRPAWARTSGRGSCQTGATSSMRRP